MIVVIPCYGYASFLPEFMTGVLAQQGDVPFRCVLVDDGDPDPEMFLTAQTYAAAYPDLFHYIRPRHNGGLSAARNAGAEYALTHWPEARVIMFPDGDDRMTPDFIATSYAAFRHEEARAQAAGQKLGWVFEHPVMIGIPGEMPRITHHSQLWNLIGATQMPSSALSMQMFREGLRYDESLKWAGEDWDFSVRALAAGYVGKHCTRQGFHWRRRPGSMSAAHGASMARAHNATVIRLKNKATFSFASIAQMLRQEHRHYCTITPAGVMVHTAFDGDSDPQRRADLTLADLARMIHTNVTLPADPCPQTVTFAPTGLPPALAGGPLGQYAGLITDFYAGQGFVVCHKLRDDGLAAGPATLAAVQHGRAHHSDMVSMSIEGMLRLLADPALDDVKFLTFEWHVPGTRTDPATDPEFAENPAPRTFSLLSREVRPPRLLAGGPTQDKGQGPRRAGAMVFAMDRLNILRTSGYAFARPVRVGRQTWQPNNLTWRSLPAHLLGAQGFFATRDLKDRDLVVCRMADVDEVVRRMAAAGRTVDLLTLDPSTGSGADGFALNQGIAKGIEQGVIDQHYPADAALSRTGPSQNFWQVEPLTQVLGLYARVLFWRTMRFANKLAIVKTLGATREVVIRDAEDVPAVLSSLSSAFKCYDVYRVLTDTDPQAPEAGQTKASDKAKIILNTYGVPNEAIRFGLDPRGGPDR